MNKRSTPMALRSHLRIVLVDDSPGVLDFAASALREHLSNATILAFQEGATAWQELMRNEPDLLVSDLVRSGLDGFQMLRLLAERQVTYPIVIASGNIPTQEPEARRCAGEQLSVTFLSKPFNAESLLKPLRDR